MWWSASKFNKLSSNTHFVIFGNHLGPQINSLLHVLIIKQKNKREKDPNKTTEKCPGGFLENLQCIVFLAL